MSVFPTAPGIPVLASGLIAPPAQSALMTQDSPSVSAQGSTAVWGIFDATGSLVVQADTIIALDYRQDWRIADFPIENGAFASYDKVQVPFDLRVAVTKGGAAGIKRSFLDAIEAAAATTTLYTVTTPEQTYSNLSFAHIDYRRTAVSGLGLLTVDLWFQQIRPAGSATVSTGSSSQAVKSPSVAGQVNDGTVQPTPATTQQEAVLGEIA